MLSAVVRRPCSSELNTYRVVWRGKNLSTKEKYFVLQVRHSMLDAKIKIVGTNVRLGIIYLRHAAPGNVQDDVLMHHAIPTPATKEGLFFQRKRNAAYHQ